MVIARKVWGGNRTWAGAQTQQVLVSLMRTCWQQDKDPFTYLTLLLRSPGTQMLDIVPAAARTAALKG
jgi:transposase